MATLTPTHYLMGFQLLAADAPAPSQGMFIPLANYPKLTAQEADPFVGDIRKIMYEINRLLFEQLSVMESAAKPTKFNITRANPVGVSGTTIRQSYTITFDLDITGVDVAFEAGQNQDP